MFKPMRTRPSFVIHHPDYFPIRHPVSAIRYIRYLLFAICYLQVADHHADSHSGSGPERLQVNGYCFGGARGAKPAPGNFLSTALPISEKTCRASLPAFNSESISPRRAATSC